MGSPAVAANPCAGGITPYSISNIVAAGSVTIQPWGLVWVGVTPSSPISLSGASSNSDWSVSSATSVSSGTGSGTAAFIVSISAPPVPGSSTQITITSSNGDCAIVDFASGSENFVTPSSPVGPPPANPLLTRLSVTCASIVVAGPDPVCTAAVDPAGPPPTGTVSFLETRGPGVVSFGQYLHPPALEYGTCNLVVQFPYFPPSTSSCSVGVTGVEAGNVTIWAVYSGDDWHYSSNYVFNITVAPDPPVSNSSGLTASLIHLPGGLAFATGSRFEFPT